MNNRPSVTGAHRLTVMLQTHSLYRTLKSILQQVAQLSQRDRAAGWVSYGPKWKTVTGRQYLRTLYVYATILRSYVLSKLLQIIGQIFAFDKRVLPL